MAGTLEGSEAWFDNPSAQASSHFGTGKAGALRQWVDTKDRAWAQAAGNRAWLSVENEGVGGDALTDAQLDRNAQVLAWAHETYGVPLQVASGTDGHGLGYHAMGGSAWGGHTSCPGARIVAQLPEIVARAKRLISGQPAPIVIKEDPMPAPTVLFESAAGGPELPAGEWTELPAAEDTAILRGPATYDVGFAVTLSGTGTAKRVQMRFVHVDIETRRRSPALSVDVPVRDGDVGVQITRAGNIPAGQYLKVEALADEAGATVTHRVIEGLVWLP